MNSSDLSSIPCESDPAKASLSLDALLSNLPGMVYRCRNDAIWTMEFVSARAKEPTGYPTHELLHTGLTKYTSLIHPDDLNAMQHEVHAALFERITTADGKQNDEDKPKSVLSINTDITQRKVAERKIQHLAFYDPLTRLPNRVYLLDRLQHALASSNRSRHTGALMFIDPDNFKTLTIRSSA